MSVKKSEQLGMSFSTANGQLRKQIMFQLVQQAGRDTCFQCGNKIEEIENLSIEHKVPWLHSENPRELFFDLNNIAFSHTKCNYGAARPGEKPKSLAVQTEITANSKTGYVGVYYEEGYKKPYRVRIRVDKKEKKMKHFGYYATPEEAAKVADEIILLHRKDMKTNKDLELI